VKKPSKQTRSTRAQGADAAPSPPDPSFLIVGVGASAGGLEALQLFFSNVPAKSGAAFVVVQHLDPTRKGMLAELLQRSTAMPVRQIKDRTEIRPDCVYVIPPDEDLSILHGTLHLLKPDAPRGKRLPIDFFLRALADDRKEQAVGVILSGMGSDGALGLRAIKERAGLALVQEPSSAKFDSMPRSAIATGVADFVAPAEELPGRILAYLPNSQRTLATSVPVDESTQDALVKTLLLLRDRTRNDFSMYKKSTVLRRIERRMGAHQIGRIDQYVRYLRETPHEVDLLFKELLIGVTSFFRDPAVWDFLRDEVLSPRMALPGEHALRAWTPGCSTGEEAFSLAICFKEALRRRNVSNAPSLQIFATDIDRNAVDKARAGYFPASIASTVAPERLDHYFHKEGSGYRIRQVIREMVVFAEQNVLVDPPFTRLDLLCCRNLLIYLHTTTQHQLIPLFHYSLKPDGVLLLGNAETVCGFADLFEPMDTKLKLYRRKSAVNSTAVNFPSSFHSAPPIARQEHVMARPKNLEALAEELILRHYSPAAVLVDAKGDILYSSARTGKYLEPAVGKPSLNIFAMAREGLRTELPIAFRQAQKLASVVRVPNAKVAANGGAQVVDLAIEPLSTNDALRGMFLILFSDVEAQEPPSPEPGHPSKTQHRAVAALQREVQSLQSELGSAREWMQSSQEELRSTNEELQSGNEELQSTNEELTTSKEELQSMNEELQTLNVELQSKVDELSRANSDMTNLLNSTEIATVFLDNHLNVRRYTEAATRIIKLIPGDVGRPLGDLANDLEYPDLMRDAGQVLRTLAFSEREVVTEDSRWFRVRIMPYRTAENVIDGLVLTFIDISVAKKLEAALRERSAEGA
jgi:chemotaxis methyl-accepting protein methylase